MRFFLIKRKKIEKLGILGGNFSNPEVMTQPSSKSFGLDPSLSIIS